MIYRIHDGHLARLVGEGLNHADHLVTANPHTNRPQPCGCTFPSQSRRVTVCGGSSADRHCHRYESGPPPSVGTRMGR